MTKALRITAGFPKLAHAVTHRGFCPKPYLTSRITLQTPVPRRARTFTTEVTNIHEEFGEMGPKPSFQLKTPKGTKDWDSSDIVIRNKVLTTAANVFRRRGGVEIDTPVFELRSILSGKYGEDSKLIYDLADQGGEECSLRYDLTVPFARYLAMNSDIQTIKRFHIGKVYRRDQPAMTKGRMREFYQCDFDVAGEFEPMGPDSLCIAIVCDILDELGWEGTYTIKLNNRKILDGIFQVCGVPDEKIRTISSAVDKLDKLPWADVRKEMTEEKGLPEDVADRIGEWVVLKGKRDLLEKLQKDEKLVANESMKQGMEELSILFDHLEDLDCFGPVSFDLSLARGLDYYTGIIYEVVTELSAPQAAAPEPAPAKSTKKSKKTDADDDRSSDPTVGYGSVAAGGRYDNLVGMFSGKKKIPCVGISFGVDRIVSVTKARMGADKALPRKCSIDVYVMAFGGKEFNGLYRERKKVYQMLQKAGISSDISWKTKPKLPKEFKAAEDLGVAFAVILGQDEWEKGLVKVKEMGLPAGHPEKEGIDVSLEDLVKEVKAKLGRGTETLAVREKA